MKSDMPIPIDRTTNTNNNNSIITASSSESTTSTSNGIDIIMASTSSSSTSSTSTSSQSTNLSNLLSSSTTTSSESIHKFLMDSLESLPGINIGHITAIHNGYVILLSGFKGYKDNSTAFYRPSEEIWIYDQIVEKWIKKICTTETDDKDDRPIERSSACATIIDNYLYMFGGFSEEGNLNTLHRLDLNQLKWRRLRPNGREPLPCDKNVCWEWMDKFYLFGGYGPVPRIWSEEFTFQFVFDSSSHWHYVRGWNNQLACYNPETNSWEWPKHFGQIPSARAACSAAKIQNKIFLFGGRMNHERMNDMYMLDMNTLKWIQIQSNNVEHPVRGRSWHSLTTLTNDLLILYGGFSHDNCPLNDCWLFDTKTWTWTELLLPIFKPRFWHSATLLPFGEMMIIGGATEKLNIAFHRSPEYNHIFAQDTITIRFEPKSLFRLCLNIISEKLLLTENLFQLIPKQLMEIVFKYCINSNNLNKLNIIHQQQQQILQQQQQEQQNDENSLQQTTDVNKTIDNHHHNYLDDD